MNDSTIGARGGNARIPSKACCALVKPPIDIRPYRGYNRGHVTTEILVVDNANDNNDEA